MEQWNEMKFQLNAVCQHVPLLKISAKAMDDAMGKLVQLVRHLNGSLSLRTYRWNFETIDEVDGKLKVNFLIPNTNKILQRFK